MALVDSRDLTTGTYFHLKVTPEVLGNELSQSTGRILVHEHVQSERTSEWKPKLSTSITGVLHASRVSCKKTNMVVDTRIWKSDSGKDGQVRRASVLATVSDENEKVVIRMLVRIEFMLALRFMENVYTLSNLHDGMIKPGTVNSATLQSLHNTLRDAYQYRPERV